MLTYLGELSIGVLLPAPYAGINVALADLGARVAALHAMQFDVTPPSYAVQLELLAQMTQNIQALIGLGISPPSIAFQIAATLELVAALEAQLAAVLAIPFGAALHAYVYTGPANAFGGELALELSTGFPGGSPIDDTLALVFAATQPAAKLAMQAVFKTTP